VLIGSDGPPDMDEPRPDGGITSAGERRTVLHDWVGIALLCACCWLTIGLLVLAAIMLGSGWLTPLLIAAALLAGAGVVLIPARLQREEARETRSALRALIAEASEQALLDAGAREPRLFAQVGRLVLLERAEARARREIE
jgi:hypothetical protein